MWSNIFIGCLLISITSFVHTVITRIILTIVQKNPKFNHHLRRITHVLLVVLIILLATFGESTIWAITYILVGSFDLFEEAIYFSLVTYTTLGYGDIILADSHRLLGAFEAANGVIMLGWSTAIVVATIQRVFGSIKQS